jgi:hypothetical protein
MVVTRPGDLVRLRSAVACIARKHQAARSWPDSLIGRLVSRVTLSARSPWFTRSPTPVSAEANRSGREQGPREIGPRIAPPAGSVPASISKMGRAMRCCPSSARCPDASVCSQLCLEASAMKDDSPTGIAEREPQQGARDAVVAAGDRLTPNTGLMLHTDTSRAFVAA